MNIDEIQNVLKQIRTARERGDWAEAHRLTTQLPLPPRLALSGKESFGIDYMRQYDLSLADAKFGKDWLNA